MESKAFDSFPAGMAAIGLGLGIAIYILGAYILSGLGIFAAVAYLCYCAFVEIAILRGSCVHCYYYGKTCGLGRGRFCELLFKRGDPRKFIEREISFCSLIPDFLVSLIPLIGGIVVLILHFSWIVLLAMLAVLVLATAGTAFVRGSMACRYCAQRELGCPAEKLFSKKDA